MLATPARPAVIASEAPQLSVDGVFKHFGGVVAVENVTRAVSSLQKLRAKLAELRTSAPAAASR